ncbi:putative Polyprotein [Cucumis melo var. makuwa]|uniref:Polyprotein n=1 Tax=Cucumis melo var. makuwa TaxID=1194695 RepID=A0A5A7UAV0_CUCMM|nr:putative Polyprotein [Cucumis melo var. makuwa]
MDDHMTEDAPEDAKKKKDCLLDDARLYLQMKNSIESKEQVHRMFEVCMQFFRAEQKAEFVTNYFMCLKKITAEAHILSDSKIPSLDDTFTRVLRIESSPNGVSTFQSISAPISKNNNPRAPRAMDGNVQRKSYDHRKPDSTEIVCNYCQVSVTISADEYAKVSELPRFITSVIFLYSCCPRPFSPAPFPSVTLADGSTSSVLGSSTIHLTPSFSLSSDRVTKKILVEDESGGLYVFDHQVSQAVVCPIVPSPFEVHCRLGHPSLFVLKKLYPEFRMPSSLLNGEIPYRVLFPTKSLFPIAPKIFGCVCFVRDICPRHTKLDLKSLKCIFLGYSRVQKGYCCYCPTLKRYLVSLDVAFFEDIPFTSSPSSLRQGEDDNFFIYEITFPTDAPPSRLLPSRVYSRRPLSQPSDSCPTSMPPSSSDLGPSDDLPIALRKGKRKCTYPISSFVFYHQLSAPTYAFITSPDSTSIPNTVHEALSHLGWQNAMIEEMTVLDDNGTWDLVSRLAGKKAIGCKWVFSVKVNPDGAVARLNARLVAKVMLKPMNVFLHGDLQEEVYMEQPPRFVAQGESVLLVVYVDDIVIAGNDASGISSLETFLQGKLGAKPSGTPMMPNQQLVKEGKLCKDPKRYRRLVEKLNYLTVTRPDIAYSVSVVSQFMSSPTMDHWVAVEQILCYLKAAPGCGNLVSWKSKKQNVVSRSSAELEYRAMTQSVCEIVWIHQLLSEIGFSITVPAKSWCDNQVALHIASNPVYKEEDTSKMPLELGTALSIEREQIDDPEIRVHALEAIYMIILQEVEVYQTPNSSCRKFPATVRSLLLRTVILQTPSSTTNPAPMIAP